MNSLSNYRKRHKFCLQVSAFSLIMLTTPLLYLSIIRGSDGSTWALMAIFACGMAISLWVS